MMERMNKHQQLPAHCLNLMAGWEDSSQAPFYSVGLKRKETRMSSRALSDDSASESLAARV